MPSFFLLFGWFRFLEWVLSKFDDNLHNLLDWLDNNGFRVVVEDNKDG